MAQANNWNPQAAHLNIRLCLEKQAQECARGDNVEAIFVNLRARFGLTQRQARDKLSTVRKEPGQKFHSLGVEILKLVRIAYPNMGAAHQEDIAVENVRRCIENRQLLRHLMTIELNTVAEICRASDDYIQAGSNLRQRPQMNVTSYSENSDLDNEVEFDCNAVGMHSTQNDYQNKPKAKVTESTSSEIAKQTKILIKIMEILDRNTKAVEKLASVQNTRQRKRACYTCGSENHMARECPNENQENSTGSQ